MIERERQTIAKEKRLRLEFKRIDRANLPDEHVSGIFDYSPKRLAALIAQGYEDALARLSAVPMTPSSESMRATLPSIQ